MVMLMVKMMMMVMKIAVNVDNNNYDNNNNDAKNHNNIFFYKCYFKKLSNLFGCQPNLLISFSISSTIHTSQ